MHETCERFLRAARELDFEAAAVRDAAPPAPAYPELAPLPDGFYVRLTRRGRRPFWCWYAPGERPGLPLLAVSPGYRAELLRWPRELAKRFCVLAVSPLGYFTPSGPDERRKVRGAWPVLHDTALGGEDTYEEWILDAMTAVRWACEAGGADADRLVFAGCSQGGGMSLVLGGVYQGRCAAVCADEPFLTGFSGERLDEVIEFAAAGAACPVVSYAQAAQRLAVADPLRYASRLTCPVLIAAGELDGECPPWTVEMMARALPGPKQYVVFPGRRHGYSAAFYRTMTDFLNELSL